MPGHAFLHVKTLLQPLSTSLCLTSPQAARDERWRVCPASFGSAFTPCTRSPVSFHKQPHLQELACCMKVTKHTEQMTSRIPTVSSNWGPSKDTINNPNNIDFWSIPCLFGALEDYVIMSASAKPKSSVRWLKSLQTRHILTNMVDWDSSRWQHPHTCLCLLQSSCHYCSFSAGPSDRSNPISYVLTQACQHAAAAAPHTL